MHLHSILHIDRQCRRVVVLNMSGPVSSCRDGGRLSIKRDKAHVLFGGTRILQHTGDKDARLRTPDGGCLAVVLRTGFETAQGAALSEPV